MAKSPIDWPQDWPRTLLIGAGVVGSAVAEAHFERGVPFLLADHEETALEQARRRFGDRASETKREPFPSDALPLTYFQVGEVDEKERAYEPVVIESIVEKRDAKRKLFASLQSLFGPKVVLGSNTSTLRIAEIMEGLQAPQQVAGVHFFMPVHQRAAVELIRADATSSETMQAVVSHAKRLGKHAVHCGDSPGFIVNRMLSPYLNQSLLLLCRGVDAKRIERAALAYGMPLSPLELIDWIGTPTMFHAGRAFWQAFPKRIDPAPLVPGMVKAGRIGRSSGAGLYDYEAGRRGNQLASETQQLVEKYSSEPLECSDGEVLLLLSIPMWIEAQCLLADGVADSIDSIDVAMVGGLGFDSNQTWSSFFVELGEDLIQQTIEKWGAIFRSMSR